MPEPIGQSNPFQEAQQSESHGHIPAEADQRLSRRPRIWTALAIPPISGLTFFSASIVMIVVAFFVVHGEFNQRLFSSPESMKAVSSSRIGLLLLVLAPQIALVIPAILAALFSPEKTLNRLSLVRGHWPYWAWIAAAAATPLVGLISSVVIGSLVEESENLQMMSDIFRAHGRSGFLIPLAFLIGATPAFCEEVLFRGYVQTRLNRSIGPIAGIVISSAMFAMFHVDWVHVIAVFPLGLFLGLVAWRSGSLLPAMLAHFVNNAVSVFSVVLGPEDQKLGVPEGMQLFISIVILAGLAGTVLTILAWRRYPLASEPLSVEQTEEALDDQSA